MPCQLTIQIPEAASDDEIVHFILILFGKDMSSLDSLPLLATSQWEGPPKFQNKMSMGLANQPVKLK